jgi:hypothetical protein
MAPQGKLVWLGCRRVRVDIPDIPVHVGQMYELHGAQKAYIEGFGIGKGPSQLCARHRIGNRFMNILEYNPAGKDKLQRSIMAQNMAQAGRIWLPANDTLFPLEDVLSEVLRFTGNEKKDAHDDVVDSLSIAAQVVDTRTMCDTQHPQSVPTNVGPYRFK